MLTHRSELTKGQIKLAHHLSHPAATCRERRVPVQDLHKDRRGSEHRTLENGGQSSGAGARCFCCQRRVDGAAEDMTHLVALGERVEVCRCGCIPSCGRDVAADGVGSFLGCSVRIKSGDSLQLGTRLAAGEASGRLDSGGNSWIVRLRQQIECTVGRYDSEAGDLTELVRAQLEVELRIRGHGVIVPDPRGARSASAADLDGPRQRNRWHLGQKWLPRFMNVSRTMAVPHRAHGFPAWPYTFRDREK